MSLRLTHEFVASKFAAEGYELLSQYKNCGTKLNFICPKKHCHSITWDGFKNGSRCAYCAGQIVTHDQVAAAFKKEGYRLLSRYENNRQKLDFICPDGHQHAINWANFQKGRRCAYCVGRVVTSEQVAAAFKKEGYRLLSKYENNYNLLDFICPNGHFHSISWGNFNNQGHRCAYCAGQIVTHDQVAAAFKKEGYRLISQYEYSHKKLDFICSKGHSHSIAWTHFSAGRRCSFCAGQIVSNEQVKLAFKKEGYQLLSRYENSQKKLSFMCPKGHIHEISWSSFKGGSRCAYCTRGVVSNDRVKAAFEKEGYQLLSEYKNSHSKLKFICPRNHLHSISWGRFNQGRRCVYCAEYGYNPTKPGRLYYLYFSGLQLYKIGITNRLVSERLCQEKNQYIILLDEYYDDGSIPLEKEKQILKKFKSEKYNGPNVIFCGHSELFVSDILRLNPYAVA